MISSDLGNRDADEDKMPIFLGSTGIIGIIGIFWARAIENWSLPNGSDDFEELWLSLWILDGCSCSWWKYLKKRKHEGGKASLMKFRRNVMTILHGMKILPFYPHHLNHGLERKHYRSAKDSLRVRSLRIEISAKEEWHDHSWMFELSSSENSAQPTFNFALTVTNIAENTPRKRES